MTIHTTPDGLGGTFVYAGPVRVGRVFLRQTGRATTSDRR